MSQTAELRRQQNRADARRAILDTTEAILVDGGYDAFSMRKLAGRCGYTAPTIYHYFGDKPGLIDALLEERMSLLVDELRRVPRCQDPAEDMRAYSRAFVGFGLRHPTHYRLLSQPRRPDTVPPKSAEEARRMLERPLAELAASGRLALGDLESAGQSLWAYLHGLISLQSSRPDLDWRDDLLDLSLDAMIRGWIRPASPALRTAPATSQKVPDCEDENV